MATDRKRTVFFIGGGNMAYAIIGGLDRNKWHVVVSELIESQRQRLERELGVTTVTSSNADTIKEASIIVLAIKPQSCKEVLQDLAKHDLTGKLVLSIMAGVSMEAIDDGLGRQKVKIVRTMPNTPILVGLGVTGVYIKDQDESAKQDVESLLGGTSQLYYVKTEDDLNAVIAVSGSSPAYFFLFIEALEQAGVELGMDRETSAKMALGTALGSATLAARSKEPVSVLRRNVMSKGGTTERAVQTFEQLGLAKIVAQAAKAARDRGREMSKMAKL